MRCTPASAGPPPSARAAQGLIKAAWTLFDGGSIRQNITLQTARQEEALSLYENTVLSALKDVESALVSYANEQTRRDSMEHLKKLKKDSEITEDEQKLGETDLQKTTDNHIKELDKIAADKEKEIMSV